MTSHLIKKWYLFLLLICFGTLHSKAQFNVKIGYTYTYAQLDAANFSIGEFNAMNSSEGIELGDLHGLNGILAGFRYRIGDIGFEATWNSRFKTLKVAGLTNTSSILLQELSYRQGNYGLGIESYLTDWLSLGGSFDFINHRFRAEATNSNDRYEVMSEWNFGSHFHLGFNISGNDLLTLSIQPYIQLPWNAADFDTLYRELNANILDNPNVMEESMSFGVRLVFYNGQW